MFKNYLKITWRNLLRNKLYSCINIAGLAVGMAVALLIVLWIVNEYSYDTFLPNYKQIYQVERNGTLNNNTMTIPYMPDYRISIGTDVFILAAIAALIITIVTISFQAIKAATANSVKNLRTE
jgi:hypothetical protein